MRSKRICLLIEGYIFLLISSGFIGFFIYFLSFMSSKNRETYTLLNGLNTTLDEWGNISKYIPVGVALGGGIIYWTTFLMLFHSGLNAISQARKL